LSAVDDIDAAGFRSSVIYQHARKPVIEPLDP
jgi:hypothetical protein